VITKGKTAAIADLAIDESPSKSQFSVKDEKILEILTGISKLYWFRWRKTLKRKRRSNGVFQNLLINLLRNKLKFHLSDPLILVGPNFNLA